jgi:GAF domain-containing protein
VTREQRLANTFVELADSLVEDFDVIDLMTLLTERSVELLDAAAAGLLLADASGHLRLIAATSEAAQTVELFQIQQEEGPCHDCFHSGTPVNVADLAADSSRWPSVAPFAVAAGFRTAHALPLRLRGEILGAMNLFRTEPVPLTASDLATAQALADVATIALIQSRVIHDSQILSDQLQEALQSRVLIEQAKGMLAERLGCGVDDGFIHLRRYARHQQRRLSQVAGDLLDGTLSAERLTD